LVYFQKTRPNNFKIILNAHLDVVSGRKEQYKPYEKDGKLFGRGAIDMKGAAAVEILVFKEIAKKVSYPLALQLVTDEEIGGFCGTKYQIEKGVRADFVIAGEPTDFGVNNKAKGIIWLKIKTKGKAAHGAYPWRGKKCLIDTILKFICGVKLYIINALDVYNKFSFSYGYTGLTSFNALDFFKKL